MRILNSATAGFVRRMRARSMEVAVDTRRLACAVMSFFFLVASGVAAEPIAWQTDPATALSIAQDKNRPVVVFLTSSHCPYCVKMRQQTFTDGKVTAALNEDFVPLYVDRGSNPEFERSLGARVYPTTVVLRADRTEIGRVTGFVAPQAFRTTIEQTAAKYVAGRPTTSK